MPTSATGPSSSFRPRAAGSAQSGFTLLEILVVVVIIGIITSMAVISVNVLGKDRQLDEEAARLRAILLQVQEEATLQGRDVGLRVDARGYDFMRYDARRARWALETEDPLLKERTLPDGIEAELWLESRRVQLETRTPPPAETETETATEQDDPMIDRLDAAPDAEDTAKKAPAPQIVVQASGDLVPFELLLRSSSSEARRAVRGNVEGQIDVQDPDADRLP